MRRRVASSSRCASCRVGGGHGVEGTAWGGRLHASGRRCRRAAREPMTTSPWTLPASTTSWTAPGPGTRSRSPPVPGPPAAAAALPAGPGAGPGRGRRRGHLVRGRPLDRAVRRLRAGLPVRRRPSRSPAAGSSTGSAGTPVARCGWSRTPTSSSDWAGTGSPDGREDAVDVGDRAEEAREATRRAVALVRTLPPDQAEVVLLRVVAGLEVAEVAELLGRSTGSVRVLSHRGLRRLAGTLAAARDSAAAPSGRHHGEGRNAMPGDDVPDDDMNENLFPFHRREPGLPADDAEQLAARRAAGSRRRVDVHAVADVLAALRAGPTGRLAGEKCAVAAFTAAVAFEQVLDPVEPRRRSVLSAFTGASWRSPPWPGRSLSVASLPPRAPARCPGRSRTSRTPWAPRAPGTATSSPSSPPAQLVRVGQRVGVGVREGLGVAQARRPAPSRSRAVGVRHLLVRRAQARLPDCRSDRGAERSAVRRAVREADRGRPGRRAPRRRLGPRPRRVVGGLRPHPGGRGWRRTRPSCSSAPRCCPATR